MYVSNVDTDFKYWALKSEMILLVISRNAKMTMC